MTTTTTTNGKASRAMSGALALDTLRDCYAAAFRLSQSSNLSRDERRTWEQRCAVYNALYFAAEQGATITLPA
jgi:hypothetical protein